MELSVVIPTFDRVRVLARALDSVLSQSFAPAEIIVVDDGSTDGTGDLVRDRYRDVRYAYQVNSGVSSARNLGIRLARSDWLAFLDSDDVWHRDKLERQRDALTAQPGYRVCHTGEVWIRNGIRVNPMKKHAKRGGRVFRDCLPLCAISPSSILIHRSVFESVGRFDESLPACEDYDLWLRICSRYPVLLIDAPLIDKYGGHADQLSRKHWGMDRFRVQALEKIIASGTLAAGDHRAAVDMLMNKTAILLQGARKHDNGMLQRECESVLARAQQAYGGLRAVGPA